MVNNMIIEIKHKCSDKVIFSHEDEGNSIAVTLKQAIQLGANLMDASLMRANLRDANLRDADLMSADLRGANLMSANLMSANLRGANLRGADLRYCVGDSKKIKTLLCATWIIVFDETRLAIGCKMYPISEWKNFTNEKISNMDGNALEFWKKWKDFIFTAIELANIND